MKKGLLVFVIFILSLSFVAAAHFEVSSDEVTDRITLQEDAKVNVTITNNDVYTEIYRFSVKNPNWNLFAEDISIKNTGLALKSGGTEKVVLILKPTSDAPGGRNTITLLVEAEKSGEVVEHEFPVVVRKDGYGGYIPAILASVEIPTEIDPREEFLIKVHFENQNVRYNENVVVKFTSNLINQEFTTTLDALENKTETYKVKLDRLTSPTTDKLKTIVEIDDTVFTPDAKEFVIIDYTGDFGMDVQETESFFKTVREITYTNTGNQESKQIAKYPIGGLASLFTTSQPKKTSVIKQDGERYMGWETTLAPTETFSVTVTTDYRWLLIVIIVIVVLLVYLKIMKAPVLISKSAKNIERKEGGISEMKVSVNVKNNSNKMLENVEIRDIVPNIAELHKDFEVGTLAPTRTFKNKSGNTVVKWDIDDLDPHEERIISYKIKSKLSILGDFDLPVAIIKYRTKKGREIIVKSNKLSISSQVNTE
ncbi:hypothetical protein KY337_04645 [Candidatus Woesearchaeota archaeon]|nr:hypothetical protein [Candidatus Woesearchaeota archaeon]